MRHRLLRIAKDLALPLDAVTKAFGVVAARGAGKSYTASVMTEQLIKAGQHVVVIDPLGVWWGLRSSGDGRHEGLPIVIFGGDHADVPLDPGSGEMIADLVINEHLSVILDIGRFNKAEQVRFVTAFAVRLYQRNRRPLHLMLDEADMFAPQRPMHGEERMLGAMEDLVRRGRARGLGMTLITQRSAVINKNVLSQVDTLVALRTFAPQDRKAIEAWVEVHGDKKGRDEVLASLATLKIGEAWFWSPGWLGILKRIQVNRRETFDSSATPKVGVRIREPKRLAQVDLTRIKDQLASTIERAKREDPRELQVQVAGLKRHVEELKHQLGETIRLQKHTEIVEEKVVRTVEKKVPWLGRREIQAVRSLSAQIYSLVEHVRKLENLWGGVPSITNHLEGLADRVESPIREAMKSVQRMGGVSIGAKPAQELPKWAQTKPLPPLVKPMTRKGLADLKMSGIKDEPSPGDKPLLAGERRMVGILKAFHPKALSRVQLLTLAGLSNSGTTRNYVNRLLRDEIIGSTSLGSGFEGFVLLKLDAPADDVSREGFRAMWDKQLLAGERRILELLTTNPDMSRADLLEQAGLSNSGTTRNYLNRLKRCGLIEIDGDLIRRSRQIQELIG